MMVLELKKLSEKTKRHGTNHAETKSTIQSFKRGAEKKSQVQEVQLRPGVLVLQAAKKILGTIVSFVMKKLHGMLRAYAKH